MTRTTLVGALAALAAVAIATPALGASPPRVKSLDYFVRDDGQLPHTRLLLDIRGADLVRVATFFHGRRAAGSLTVDERISGDPWVLEHRGSGEEVYELIRRSLARRGTAVVRVRARNEAGSTRARLRIRKSKCTKDPPFYPLDCTVHP